MCFQTCAQRRFRSNCTFVQSDQNLHWAPLDSLGWKDSSCRHQRLIRQSGCAGWFESSLGTHVRRYIFSLPGLCPWRAYVVTQSLASASVGICITYMPYLTLWDKISQNLAHLEGNSHKKFKSHRIFRPFYHRFYEEINIKHTLLWFSQASSMKKNIL